MRTDPTVGKCCHYVCNLIETRSTRWARLENVIFGFLFDFGGSKRFFTSVSVRLFLFDLGKNNHTLQLRNLQNQTKTQKHIF